MGNHELWNYDQNGIKQDVNSSSIIREYRNLFKPLDITFLQNDLLIQQDYFTKIIPEKLLIDMDPEDLRELCSKSSFFILGGLGFSGYCKDFTATNGIYRNTIQTLKEDMTQTKRFEKIYDKILNTLGANNVIVLTHTPKDNWSLKKYNKNWIYINGHTHRNYYVVNEDKLYMQIIRFDTVQRV